MNGMKNCVVKKIVNMQRPTKFMAQNIVNKIQTWCDINYMLVTVNGVNG